MKDSLELIIKDIYTLDPSLVEQDGEVRALVSAFSEQKPVVVVDAAFVQSLRADLVKPARVMPVAVLTKSPWWMVYGAPVGVLALLLIMLIPKTEPVHNEVPTIAPSPVREADMYFESYSDGAEEETKRSAPAGGAAESMMMEADTMMMSAPVSGDTFQISTQAPGDTVVVDFASLEQAGYLVIQAYTEEGPGEVLGTSPLLAAGMIEQVQITLNVTTEPDQTFFAVLYHDDGDGLFSPEADMMVYDQSGTVPLSQLFSTTPTPLP